MTNHAAFAYADAPLFLFHLLEFSGVPFDLNVREINERWAQPRFIDSWSQVVMKFTEEKVDQVTHAPATGIYRMAEDGSVAYQRFDYERRAIDTEREAFFMRITGPGDYRYEGADLGILITRGRSMDDNFKLNIRARDWIRGIKNYYAGKPVMTTQHDAAPAPARSRSCRETTPCRPSASASRPSRRTSREKWHALFERSWPAYRSWFLRGGVVGRPTYLECRRALREHMPELVRVWEQLTELAGGGDVEARFLSLWCPPAYIAGCSQSVWIDPQGHAEPRCCATTTSRPRCSKAIGWPRAGPGDAWRRWATACGARWTASTRMAWPRPCPSADAPSRASASASRWCCATSWKPRRTPPRPSPSCNACPCT